MRFVALMAIGYAALDPSCSGAAPAASGHVGGGGPSGGPTLGSGAAANGPAGGGAGAGAGGQSYGGGGGGASGPVMMSGGSFVPPKVGAGGGAGGPTISGGAGGGTPSGGGGSSGPQPITLTGFTGCQQLLEAWVQVEGPKNNAPASYADCSDFAKYAALLSTNAYIGMDAFGNSCIRDGYVAAAIGECWGAYCDSLQPQTVNPLGGASYLDTTYVQPAYQNLCSANSLCSDAPCVTAGPSCPVPCLTVPIYGCPAPFSPPTTCP